MKTQQEWEELMAQRQKELMQCKAKIRTTNLYKTLTIVFGVVLSVELWFSINYFLDTQKYIHELEASNTQLYLKNERYEKAEGK